MDVRGESLNDDAPACSSSLKDDAIDKCHDESQTNQEYTHYFQNRENFSHSISVDSIKASSKHHDSIQMTTTKSREIKSQVNFDQNMNYESICVSLIKVFISNYDSACENDSIISDYLSVRELRTIVKALKLCDGSDIFNHRKPSLCQMVQAFISTDEMKNRHKKYIEERERIAKIRAEKKLERQKAQEKENRLVSSKKPTKPKEITTNVKTKELYDIEEKQPKKEKSMPIIMTTLQIPTCTLNTSPKTIADSAKALQVLKKLNGYIWELSARISELERAASMLLIKISEAEKLYEI